MMGFCDLSRKVISATEHKKLTDDPLYGLFASYSGDDFKVSVVFDGNINTDSPPDYFNIVRLEYKNRVVDEKGERWVVDPVMSEGYYEVIDAIDQFREIVTEAFPDIGEEELLDLEFSSVKGYMRTLPKTARAAKIEAAKEEARLAVLNTPQGYGDSW